MAIAWLLAATAVLVQTLTNTRYGYFRDELYFIAASDHLDWGYVDFAPLVALVTRATRLLGGESLHALRLLPALAQGGEILLTGLVARALGGKRFAVLLSSLSILVAPVVLGNATRLSMNPFEPLFWMGSVLLLVLALRRGQPKLLLWCGVLLGLGLENKHSAAFFILSLVVGLLATPDRRVFANRWFWIAGGVAFLIFLPNLVWQYLHRFPTLEDLRNVQRIHKNIELAPLPFVRQQIMMLNPVSAPVWIGGLAYLLFHREGKRDRSLGVTYLVFLVVMMALKGKDYYLAPIYPLVFAAGGVFWEKLAEARSGTRWLKVALPGAVLAAGILAAPLVVPILPVERIVPYMASLGVGISRTETHQRGSLPQHFGDEFGWPEMVAQVAGVYHALPGEERVRTGILAGNYGEAGAIDFFGGAYGLPKAISAHQNYSLWGPREFSGEELILLQWNRESAERWCRSVEDGPTLDPPYGMADENYTILICRGFKKPLAEAWPELTVWN